MVRDLAAQAGNANPERSTERVAKWRSNVAHPRIALLSPIRDTSTFAEQV
jgi:hypothetical protein